MPDDVMRKTKVFFFAFMHSIGPSAESHGEAEERASR